MESEPSDKTPMEGLERVRRNVIRTIIDEVRREIDSLEKAGFHSKADTHKKSDLYVKGYTQGALR